MRCLLDTHVLLWWLVDDSRLRPGVRGILSDRHNILLFSAASAWDIMIKVQSGKLKLSEDNPASYVRRVLSEHDLEVLPVGLEHSLRVLALPLHH